MQSVFTQGREKMLAVWLNNFQLQDKLHLVEALKDESAHIPFELSVQQFVDDFEQTYSVDAPYPKRIGRWVGLRAPQSVIDRLVNWSRETRPHQNASRYREEFGAALEFASNIDRSTRPPLAA